MFPISIVFIAIRNPAGSKIAGKQLSSVAFEKNYAGFPWRCLPFFFNKGNGKYSSILTKKFIWPYIFCNYT